MIRTSILASLSLALVACNPSSTVGANQTGGDGGTGGSGGGDPTAAGGALATTSSTGNGGSTTTASGSTASGSTTSSGVAGSTASSGAGGDGPLPVCSPPDGIAVAQILRTVDEGLDAIAVDGSYLYVSTRAKGAPTFTFERLGKGTLAPSGVFSETGQVRGIAVAANGGVNVGGETNLASGASVVRLSPGGAADPLYGDDGFGHYAADIALGANDVVFTDYNRILSVPMTGPGETVIHDYGLSVPAIIEDVHVDGSEVYWASAGATDVPSEILRAPIAGGNAETIVQAPYYGCGPGCFSLGLQAVVTDATYVYFADAYGGTVSRKPKAGGAIEQLYLTDKPLYDVILVGNDLVWTETLVPCGAFVRKMPKAGGAATTLSFIEGRATVHGLVTDGTHVYVAAALTEPDNFNVILARRLYQITL